MSVQLGEITIVHEATYSCALPQPVNGTWGRTEKEYADYFYEPVIWLSAAILCEYGKDCEEHGLARKHARTARIHETDYVFHNCEGCRLSSRYCLSPMCLQWPWFALIYISSARMRWPVPDKRRTHHRQSILSNVHCRRSRLIIIMAGMRFFPRSSNNFSIVGDLRINILQYKRTFIRRNTFTRHD